MQPSLRETTGQSTATTLFMNPLIAKLSKITEVSEDSATYSGIMTKSFGFMLAIFLGAAIPLLLQSINPIVVDQFGEITVPDLTVILLVVSLVFFVLTPFLAFLIRPTIPVTGTLYCISTGYIFSFLAMMIEEYRGLILLAILMTVVIVAVMAFVYTKGWIKVNQKFRNVISILFWSVVGTSLLTGVCYLVPALKCVPDFLMSNPLLGIGGAVVYVVIASLFLMVDFDTIQKAVNNKLPRKYEWYASFGLVFSVIWLFLKLFDLFVKAKNANNQSSK